MADSWPYNEVVFKASHNSFERDERPITEQLTFNRRTPHQAGCRGLELDLRESPNLTVWAVDHDEYTARADRQFAAFLAHLKRWSTMHPSHDVITITLDLKARARDRRTFPRYLDAMIDESLGRDLLFTPGEMIGNRRSLVAAAMSNGWPSLGELAGRFVLCLSGDEPTKRSYASAGRSRLCFADRRVLRGDRFPARREGDRIFFNFNAAESWSWDGRLKWFARQRGFITRAYGVNSDDLWDRVVAADANIVATDKVRNHQWARVGTEPFGRISASNRPPTTRQRSKA